MSSLSSRDLYSRLSRPSSVRMSPANQKTVTFFPSSTEIVDQDERGVGYRGDGTRRAAGWNAVRAAGGAGYASGSQRANLLPLPTGQSISSIQARLGRVLQQAKNSPPQVSYGEMIGCDNADCPIEWFHFGCMNLTTKPKGKWYCPKCITQFKKKK